MTKKIVRNLMEDKSIFYFTAFLIFLSGFLLVLYTTSDGILLTDDSCNYLFAARSFTEHQTLLNPDGSRFSSWPPLFSLVLSVWIFKLGWPAENLFLFLYTGLFLLNWLLLNRLSGNRGLLLFSLALVHLGVGFIMIHSFLWSESLFLLMYTGMILIFMQYVIHRKNTLFIWLLVLSSLLCLQRNAGLLFLAAGCLSYFILYRRNNPEILRVLVFFIVGSAASVLWNISVSTYTHFHFEADFILINIFNLSDVLSRWFLPGILPVVLRMVFLLLVLGLAATGLFTSTEGKDHRPVLMITLINVFYFFSISCSGKLDVWEMERYLSVIYPFFIITFVYSLDNLKSIFQRKKLFYFIPFFLILWGMYSFSRTIKNSCQWHERSRMEVIPENCQKIKKDF